MPEICERCGHECSVTFYLKGPVKPQLVCLACKEGKPCPGIAADGKPYNLADPRNW